MEKISLAITNGKYPKTLVKEITEAYDENGYYTPKLSDPLLTVDHVYICDTEWKVIGIIEEGVIDITDLRYKKTTESLIGIKRNQYLLYTRID